eukprot:1421966-Karenia_brevis.AAC.1
MDPTSYIKLSDILALQHFVPVSVPSQPTSEAFHELAEFKESYSQLQEEFQASMEHASDLQGERVTLCVLNEALREELQHFEDKAANLEALNSGCLAHSESMVAKFKDVNKRAEIKAEVGHIKTERAENELH